MTNIWTSPTARKRHRCHMCWRIILPGETYWRMAGLDHGHAWTYKACPHCYRVAAAFSRQLAEEWDTEVIFEWLAEEHPALWASLRAGWRYPDGELLPLPFQPRCLGCGEYVTDGHLWCLPCDERRIARIEAALTEMRESLR